MSIQSIQGNPSASVVLTSQGTGLPLFLRNLSGQETRVDFTSNSSHYSQEDYAAENSARYASILAAFKGESWNIESASGVQAATTENKKGNPPNADPQQDDQQDEIDDLKAIYNDAVKANAKGISQFISITGKEGDQKGSAAINHDGSITYYLSQSKSVELLKRVRSGEFKDRESYDAAYNSEIEALQKTLGNIEISPDSSISDARGNTIKALSPKDKNLDHVLDTLAGAEGFSKELEKLNATPAKIIIDPANNRARHINALGEDIATLPSGENKKSTKEQTREQKGVSEPPKMASDSLPDWVTANPKWGDPTVRTKAQEDTQKEKQSKLQIAAKIGKITGRVGFGAAKAMASHAALTAVIGLAFPVAAPALASGVLLSYMYRKNSVKFEQDKEKYRADVALNKEQLRVVDLAIRKSLSEGDTDRTEKLSKIMDKYKAAGEDLSKSAPSKMRKVLFPAILGSTFAFAANAALIPQVFNSAGNEVAGVSERLANIATDSPSSITQYAASYASKLTDFVGNQLNGVAESPVIEGFREGMSRMTAYISASIPDSVKSTISNAISSSSSTLAAGAEGVLSSGREAFDYAEAGLNQSSNWFKGVLSTLMPGEAASAACETAQERNFAQTSTGAGAEAASPVSTAPVSTAPDSPSVAQPENPSTSSPTLASSPSDAVGVYSQQLTDAGNGIDEINTILTKDFAYQLMTNPDALAADLNAAVGRLTEHLSIRNPFASFDPAAGEMGATAQETDQYIEFMRAGGGAAMLEAIQDISADLEAISNATGLEIDTSNLDQIASELEGSINVANTTYNQEQMIAIRNGMQAFGADENLFYSQEPAQLSERAQSQMAAFQPGGAGGDAYLSQVFGRAESFIESGGLEGVPRTQIPTDVNMALLKVQELVQLNPQGMADGTNPAGHVLGRIESLLHNNPGLEEVLRESNPQIGDRLDNVREGMGNLQIATDFSPRGGTITPNDLGLPSLQLETDAISRDEARVRYGLQIASVEASFNEAANAQLHNQAAENMPARREALLDSTRDLQRQFMLQNPEDPEVMDDISRTIQDVRQNLLAMDNTHAQLFFNSSPADQANGAYNDEHKQTLSDAMRMISSYPNMAEHPGLSALHAELSDHYNLVDSTYTLTEPFASLNPSEIGGLNGNPESVRTLAEMQASAQSGIENASNADDLIKASHHAGITVGHEARYLLEHGMPADFVASYSAQRIELLATAIEGQPLDSVGQINVSAEPISIATMRNGALATMPDEIVSQPELVAHSKVISGELESRSEAPSINNGHNQDIAQAEEPQQTRQGGPGLGR